MPLSLAYRDYGKGPPIVILHGLFGSAQNWHLMAERLAQSYRVFACDLRNHGGSPWADSMTFPEMADDLEALIDEKNLAPAIVLGHSVGGKTAMLVALKHPDLIDALIVVDIAPVSYEEPFLDYIRAMQNAGLSDERRRAAPMPPPGCSCCRTWSSRMAASNGGSTSKLSPRTCPTCSASRTSRRSHTKDARCSSAAPAPTTSAAPTTARSTSCSHRPSSPSSKTPGTIRTSNSRSSSAGASPASWRAPTPDRGGRWTSGAAIEAFRAMFVADRRRRRPHARPVVAKLSRDAPSLCARSRRAPARIAGSFGEHRVTSAPKPRPNRAAWTACPISQRSRKLVQSAGRFSGVQPLSAAFTGATVANQTARPAVTKRPAATVHRKAGLRWRTCTATTQVIRIDSSSMAAPTTANAPYRFCWTVSQVTPSSPACRVSP